MRATTYDGPNTSVWTDIAYWAIGIGLAATLGWGLHLTAPPKPRGDPLPYCYVTSANIYLPCRYVPHEQDI